ncbi:hypothetical protein ACP70R_030361 [Stipagrostis hirtigluma subsp. patula]
MATVEHLIFHGVELICDNGVWRRWDVALMPLFVGDGAPTWANGKGFHDHGPTVIMGLMVET